MASDDFFTLYFAVTNNVGKLFLTSSLDPFIIPSRDVEFSEYAPHLLDLNSYLSFFEDANPSTSEYPLVVEYFKAKHALKSFEVVTKEYESGRKGDVDDNGIAVELSEYISHGSIADFFLADLFLYKVFGDADFLKEAHSIAVDGNNLSGAKLCTDEMAAVGLVPDCP